MSAQTLRLQAFGNISDAITRTLATTHDFLHGLSTYEGTRASPAHGAGGPAVDCGERLPRDLVRVISSRDELAGGHVRCLSLYVIRANSSTPKN